MSMQFSTAPYFDDFDPAKNFYKVLFKPGYAVQARELNQLQSILLHQINGVSGHLFKKNTMIIPGGISFNDVADIVNISGNIDPSVLVGKTITNATSGFDPKDDRTLDGFITAVVLGYEAATSSLPAAIYVKYFKTNSDGRMYFNKSELIKTVETSGQILSFNVHNTYGTSVGKVATAAKGLFYTKNLFVDTETQSVIVDRNRDTVTNGIIGFKVVESIVTADEDDSLLDNAAGSPNQYAPGADRYKVSLEIACMNLGSTIDEDNFITLMVIENNVITYVNNKTQYAELMKTLARRTYDTNGNFIVGGLNATVNDSTNSDYIWANISRGKCYLGGYEHDQIYNLPLAIEKPRNEDYQETVPLINRFASGLTYFYVAGGTKLTEIPERDSLVQFLNAAPGTPNVSVIGYGVFRDIQYSHGDINNYQDVYRAYFDNISFDKGYSLSDVGGFKTIIATDELYPEKQGAPILHVLRVNGLIGSMIDRITTADGSDSKQNLIKYSQNFTRWSSVNIGVGTVFEPFLDGTITSTRITAKENNATLTQMYKASPGDYNFSLYIKRISGTGAVSITVDGTNWVNHAVTTEWLSLPFYASRTFSSAGNKSVGIKIATKNDVVLIFGAQLENSLTPSNVYTLTTDQPISLATGSCSIHNQSGNSFYVIKDSVTRPVPNTSTIWCDGGAIGTANLTSTFISNYSPQNVPLIRIDNNTIKSLYTEVNNTFINNTSYRTTVSFVTKNIPQFESSYSESFTITSGIFDSFSTTSFMGFVERPYAGIDQPLDLSGLIEIDAETRQEFTITITDPDLRGAQGIIIVATVIKSNVNETKKVVVPYNDLKIAEPSSSFMALYHQDIISIDKIVHGKSLNITNAEWNDTINTLTFTTSANHGLKIDETVVIKDVNGGIFGVNFNGRFTVKSIPIENNVIQLNKFAVVEITSQPSEVYTPDSSGGVVYLPADTSSDVDITSRFILDNGRTPFTYGTGFIKLKKGAIAPVGQIAVKYNYYDLQGNRTYLSVDSYGSYASDDLGYIGQIPDIKFNDGMSINTRSFLDFRVRTSKYFFKNVGTYTYSNGVGVLALKDLNLSALGVDILKGKYIVGPGHRNGATINSVRVNHTTGNTELILDNGSFSDHTGIFYIGLNTSSLSLVDTSSEGGGASFIFPKDGDILSYSYVKFLPKQLMVYINRDGDNLSVKYDTVKSYNEVLALRRNEFKLPLLYIYMNPYTLGIQDVSISKFENPVYHMLDIHDIKQRVDRNEYYTSLALNNDVHQQIVDAQNENVTESSYGFWNEDFMDMSVQAISDNDFACTIYDKSYAAPGTITRTIRLELVNNLNTDTWRRTGTNITLPYTEMRYINNQFASTFNNLNPYNVINWIGKMTLNPSVDNWIDVTVLPTSEIATLEIKTKTAPVTVIPPPTVIEPPVILPPPPPLPAPEIVTAINNLRTSWGPDTRRGFHAITFDWVTSTGRTGRVNTDRHISPIVQQRGHNGTYARSLINRRYDDNDVRTYLQAGTHFDQKPPSSYW